MWVDMVRARIIEPSTSPHSAIPIRTRSTVVPNPLCFARHEEVLADGFDTLRLVIRGRGMAFVVAEDAANDDILVGRGDATPKSVVVFILGA